MDELSGSLGPESTAAWRKKTASSLDDSKKRIDAVRKLVESLEHEEVRKIEAQAKEKKRLEALAAAELERKRREEAKRREEELKAQLAADLKKHKEALELAKKEAAADKKAATAKFLSFGEEERKAKEISVRVVAVKNLSARLLECTLDLQHARSIKFGVLMVCRRRIMMREARPAQETFRDPVDDALAHEGQTLVAGREKLGELAKDCEQVRDEIERARHLLCTGPSRENVTSRLQKSASLPALQRPPSSPSALECPSSPSNSELMKISASLLERAMQLMQGVDAAIAKSDDECTRATNATTAALDRRKADTDSLIQGLRAQRAEIRETIADAEKRIVGLKRRSIRVDKTEADVEATEKQLRDAESLVAQLKAVKELLEEDLRRKTAALKIDESCRTLTKARVGADSYGDSAAPSPMTSPKNRSSLSSLGSRTPDASRMLASPAGARSPKSSPGELLLPEAC